MKKKKLKVAETYIKLNIEFNEGINRELEIVFRKAVVQSLREFKYRESIVYEIDFTKGSTKAKVAFFAFLNGMIFYADLKESIKTVYNDVKVLSKQVINNVRLESDLIDRNIIRAERRTGVIGRLNAILKRIEFLQENLNNVGNNQTQVELNELYQEVTDIIQLLDDAEQQTFIQALPQEVSNNLPIPNPNEVQHFQRLYAIKPENDDE